MEIIENSSDPLYLQLAQLIENKILSGVFAYGDKIPSEGQLIKEYQLSRVTVRNAIQKLADEGKVEKKQGKGVYVSFPVFKESFSAGGSFTSSGKLLKNEPTSKIISKETLHVSRERQYELGFDKQELQVIKRVRKINNQAVIFEIDYFSSEMTKIVSELKNEDSLIELLKKEKAEINHFDHMIDLCFSNDEISQQLNVELNTPVLRIVQQVMDSNDKLIYTNEQFINSKVYKVAIRSY